jgi:hypothetical protein
MSSLLNQQQFFAEARSNVVKPFEKKKKYWHL